MELKRCDSALAQVLKTVGWNSATFRAYLCCVEDEAANTRLILMNRAGEESSGDESECSPASASHPDESLAASSSSIYSTSESL